MLNGKKNDFVRRSTRNFKHHDLSGGFRGTSKYRDQWVNKPDQLWVEIQDPTNDKETGTAQNSFIID